MRFRKNASNLHKTVGFCLNQGKFAGCTARQEVSVSDILPSYPYKMHCFDWIVEELLCVFECHGEQHYHPVSFASKKNSLDVVENFHNQQLRDGLKEQAAVDAGYTYIVVPYSDLDKITPDYLYSLYLENRL